ncbi:ABC transporter permease [Bacillus sp. 1P06AnD]|uniref:ABC transporter permease n=1 Tax=Bacillus sp. 1P06AnD TaxID=3132208 RepID=UPI0039A1923B
MGYHSKWRWERFLFLFLIAELVVFAFMAPGFFDLNNLLYSVNDFAFIALAAIPMTFVIIAGGIDVSVGSVMGLTSIVTGVLWKNGIDLPFAIMIALICAMLAGALNGLIIIMTGVQPLVITLGGMFLFSGIALVISGGSSASGYEGISGFPAQFSDFSNGTTMGIPHSLWLLIVTSLVFGLLLHRTRYGRKVFLVGVNRNAAFYSGISTKQIILSTYIFSSLGGGMAGIVLTSYFSSARSDLGSESVLHVITAVVLGGTSILGGKGSVIGTLIASFVIGIMQYGLQMSEMTSEETSVVIGFMLILAILFRNSHIHFFRMDKWLPLKRRHKE